MAGVEAPGSGVVEWFVIFPLRPVERLRWWQVLLRPGYRHCLALRADGDGKTLVIEYAGGYLTAEVYCASVAFMVDALREGSVAAVLSVRLPVLSGPPRLQGPLTCVEAVKAVLGIRAFAVLTPWQLACHLRSRYGARRVLGPAL